MLLAGLLTRATLEGYLSAGWRGLKPVEVLLGVGLGFHEGEYAEEDEGELLSGWQTGEWGGWEVSFCVLLLVAICDV